MTLDGTRTYLVGRSRVAILDPGTAAAPHLDAICQAVADAEQVTLVVTHQHPDHSGGAAELARRLGTWPRSLADGSLREGDRIPTDQGELVVLETPGHAPDHVSVHWPDAGAVFCGDLMMGGLDTAVVAAPEGHLGDYLESLARIRRLRPRIIYPAHGPPFTAPDEAVDRYVEHRRKREGQVLAALAAGNRGTAAITDAIYGPGLDPGLRPFAESAVDAYLEHLRSTGRLPPGGP
jgi:glyoxylase-like metal-dependent hydrolase (beta-lactamase superfamily II)